MLVLSCWYKVRVFRLYRVVPLSPSTAFGAIKAHCGILQRHHLGRRFRRSPCRWHHRWHGRARRDSWVEMVQLVSLETVDAGTDHVQALHDRGSRNGCHWCCCVFLIAWYATIRAELTAVLTRRRLSHQHQMALGAGKNSGMHSLDHSRRSGRKDALQEGHTPVHQGCEDVGE
jgi:hypothetical protein